MSDFIRPEYEPLIKSTLRIYHDEVVGQSWPTIRATIEDRINCMKSDIYNRISRFQKGTLPLSPKVRGYIGKANTTDKRI